MQNTEETIAKYAVDGNPFRLGSTNPKKNMQPRNVFWWRAKHPTKMRTFVRGFIYSTLIVGELLYRGLIVGGLLT